MIGERREYTTRTVEYVLPSGTSVPEFDKAWSAALAEYKRHHGLDGADDPGSDWVRIYSGDDEIVLRMEFKTVVAR